MPRHFLDLFDINADEARMLLDRASVLKKAPFEPPGHAAGKILGLIFEKPSLRTRLSFEAAMAGLGGTSTFLRGKDVGLGVRESVRDFARVVSQYVAALAMRTFAHGKIEELARHSAIPIINALSDDAHPCQAMADLLTVRDAFGRLDGSLKLVFVGDGNNVARSLAVASALFGVSFVLTAPPDYDFPAAFRSRFTEAFPDVTLTVETDPGRAVSGAPCRLYRRLGQHGPGGRGGAPGGHLRALPGQRRALLARRPLIHLPPLPASAPGRGGHR